MVTPRLRAHRIVLALIALFALVSMPAHAAQPAALAPVASDDDFATQIFGNPWDMSGAEDIAFEFTRDKSTLSNLRFENGQFVATSTTNDPRVTIMVPSNPSVNPVPGDGGFRSIDADSYRYLTARVFVPLANPQADFDGVQVFWQPVLNSDFGSTDLGKLIGRYTKNGWNTVTFDLKTMATSSGPAWQGNIQGLYLDPTVRPNIEFKIDFIRLSKNPPSTPIELPGGSGDLLIKLAGAPDSEAELVTKDFGGSFTWPVGLAAGSYELSAGNARDTLQVNATPQLEITAPSYISGPDFATEVRGQGWDMNDASEIDGSSGLSSISFQNGLLVGVSQDFGTATPCGDIFCGDPQVTLHSNSDKRIDTSRYKYLTYRMKLSGAFDTPNGSVGRLYWVNTTFDKASESLSWVVFEGWRTVTFDLSQLRLESGGTPWSQSNPYVLRLDPHEFAVPRQFEIDYVLLTGDDSADEQFDIRYNLGDSDSQSPRVQFFYTTTPGATSGGTAIICATTTAANPQQVDKKFVFLPLLSSLGPAKPVVPTGSSCRWDTSQLPAGTYSVYGMATDGLNSITATSKTAVIISH